MKSISILAALAAVSMAAMAAAAVSQNDRAFVQTAAQAGKAEVLEAKLAVQRGVDANVKNFAHRMINDHSRMNASLARVAAKQGISLPSGLDPSDQTQIAKLRTLTGRHFDQTYSDFQVQNHRAAVGLFTGEANTGQNAQLRQFAATNLPMLKQHNILSGEVAAALQPTSSLQAHRKTPAPDAQPSKM